MPYTRQPEKNSSINRHDIAFEAACKFLRKKRRTEQEVYVYLDGRGYTPDTADRVINRLKEYGLVNDEEYARDVIEKKGSCWGALRLAGQLRAKGVPEVAVKSLVGHDAEAEYRMALSLAIKRQRERGSGCKLQGIAVMLHRRGFESAVVERVLNYLQDA